MPSKPKSSHRSAKTTPAKKQYFKLSPTLKRDRDARREAGIQDAIARLRIAGQKSVI
jgi:hypothetical protein